jgi:hypothetical protein
MQKVATWLVSSTPVGPALWNAYYPSLYTGSKPTDFAAYQPALKVNLAEPGRFRAVAAMAAAGHDAAEAALPPSPRPRWSSWARRILTSPTPPPRHA